MTGERKDRQRGREREMGPCTTNLGINSVERGGFYSCVRHRCSSALRKFKEIFSEWMLSTSG